MAIKITLTRPNGKNGFVFRGDELGAGSWTTAYFTKSTKWVLLETEPGANGQEKEESKDLLVKLSGKNYHLPEIKYLGANGGKKYYHTPYYECLGGKARDDYNLLSKVIAPWNQNSGQKKMDPVTAVMESTLKDSLKIAFYMMVSTAIKDYGKYMLDLKWDNVATGKRGQLILRDLIAVY